MKKFVFLLCCIFIPVLGFAQTESFPYAQVDPADATNNLDIGKTFKTDVIDDNSSVTARLLEVVGFSSATPNEQGSTPATTYIKVIVQYALRLVAFIAVVVLIYGFYMMFFSGQEEGFEKAQSYVKGAAIAIIIIFFAWIITQFLFDIFTAVRTD